MKGLHWTKTHERDTTLQENNASMASCSSRPTKELSEAPYEL